MSEKVFKFEEKFSSKEEFLAFQLSRQYNTPQYETDVWNKSLIEINTKK